MRTWHKALLTIVILYVLLCGAALWVMSQPPERFGRIMAHVPNAAFIILPFRPLWFVARGGHLRPGDPAPGFALPTQDKKETVRLAAYRGTQPVVLVFGSYT